MVDGVVIVVVVDSNVVLPRDRSTLEKNSNSNYVSCVLVEVVVVEVVVVVVRVVVDVTIIPVVVN